MTATRVFYDKQVLPDGAIIEMVIWRLPHTNAERPHGLKYRLYYGKAGKRLVGYDNERGKGDHRHIYECEESYVFRGPEQLIDDFIRDIKVIRGEL